MEIGDGPQDYAKWQNSIIFAINSVWETTQPAACRYYTVIKSSAIWLVSPTFWRCPRKLVYSDQMFFLSLHMLKNSWPTRLNKSMENSYTWGHGINHCHLQLKSWDANQPQTAESRGEIFGETPYKTVATSVYKFGTEPVQIESWEAWTYQLSSWLAIFSKWSTIQIRGSCAKLSFSRWRRAADK